MNTGELQKYIDQQFSGMKNDIQSISWRFLEQQQYIYTTVKNEQYKDIISTSNSTIANVLTWFWIIIAIFVVIIWIIWFFLTKYIDNKIIQVEEIKGEISDISKQSKKDIEEINNKTQDFIKWKEKEISKIVMQAITDSYFERIRNYPNDWDKFVNLIYATDDEYISTQDKYELLLKHSIVSAYQFFPHKLLIDRHMQKYIEAITKRNWSYNYHYEVIEWNKWIFNEYKKDKSLKDELIIYVKWLVPIINHKNSYPDTENQIEMTNDLEKHMKEVWLGKERNDIINPPVKPEVIETILPKS